MLAFMSITLSVGRPCLLDMSKSLKSCAGVILTAPVPKSIATESSPMTGISLSVSGNFIIFPINALYRSSSGFTATAVSPSIVSGRVVATVRVFKSPTGPASG